MAGVVGTGRLKTLAGVAAGAGTASACAAVKVCPAGSGDAVVTTASDSSGSSKSTRRIGLFLPLGAMPQNPAASVPVYAVFFQASRFDDFLLRFDVFFTKFRLGRFLTNRLPIWVVRFRELHGVAAS